MQWMELVKVLTYWYRYFPPWSDQDWFVRVMW